MTAAKQNLKMLKKQYAMIEKLNESFEVDCSGVTCGDCPFDMGGKKLPITEDETTGCAYAAMSVMLQKLIKNTAK
jgi:hypothetical protein